jgi:DNA-directed RNA polymerase specialized sigma24 family protein
MGYDLDSTSLQALLRALRPDSSDSAVAYEQLRVALIRFFRWNHCWPAEELADLAIDRLAGKLREDDRVIAHPARFALGIARLVVQEHRLRQDRQSRALSEYASANHDEPEEEKEQRLATLEACLSRLSPSNRYILERYYTGDAGDRIRNRRQLAAELGLDRNALRNRALRLRRQLEDCIERRLGDDHRRDRSAQNNTIK